MRGILLGISMAAIAAGVTDTLYDSILVLTGAIGIIFILTTPDNQKKGKTS